MNEVYIEALKEMELLVRELEDENARLREALEEAQDWANQIAGDERICGWVHGEDYGLYCFLADCPVDFDTALNPKEGKEPL